MNNIPFDFEQAKAGVPMRDRYGNSIKNVEFHTYDNDWFSAETESGIKFTCDRNGEVRFMAYPLYMDNAEWIPVTSNPTEPVHLDDSRTRQVLSIDYDKKTRILTIRKTFSTSVVRIPEDMDADNIIFRCINTGAIPLF